MSINIYTNLNQNEKTIIDLYKGNNEYNDTNKLLCTHINESLRNSTPLDADFSKAVEELDLIIAKGKSDVEITLYRTTRISYIENFMGNETYTDPGYLSTTRCISRLQRHFANSIGCISTILKIKCSANATMIDMEDNASFGGNESEILLPRNTILSIISKKEIIEKSIINNIAGAYYGGKIDKIIEYELSYE